MKTVIYLFDGPYNPNGVWQIGIIILMVVLPFYIFFNSGTKKREVIILSTLIWLPIIVEYLMSQFLNYFSGAAIFQVKHMIATLPFILILLAYHIDVYKNFYLKGMIVFFILFLNFSSILQYFQYDLNTNWPQTGKYLEKTVKKNDGVILMPDLASSSLDTYYKPKFKENRPHAFSVESESKDSIKFFLEKFYKKYISKRKRIFLIIRKIGVKYGEFFKRDRLLYDKIMKNFKVERVNCFSASPEIRVIELSKEDIKTNSKIDITLRVNLSKLYFLKYFHEIGLLKDINVEIMVNGSDKKMAAKLIDEDNYIYELKYSVSKFFPIFLTFHTIIDTGIKNGIIAYYFYVGESGEFSFTSLDNNEVVQFINPTMRDPFLKIFKDLFTIILMILIFYATILLIFKKRKLE